MSVSLAHAHALMRLAHKRGPERRRFRRVDVDLRGRMMGEGGRESDCRTLDVSPGDARLMSSGEVPAHGSTLIVYLQRLGRLEAKVVRLEADDGRFAVLFTATPHKREKLAEALTSLMNPLADGDENRREPRYVGAGDMIVELEDGAQLPCEIVDFSVVGVAVRTARPRPLLGAWVRIGNAHGRVARYFEGGFAVDFQASRL